jgi:hypothetical protein
MVLKEYSFKMYGLFVPDVSDQLLTKYKPEVSDCGSGSVA